MAKLYEEHGVDLIDRAVDEILDRSEARMRELIGAIPDGRYSFEDWLDECGTECGPIKVAVDIDVAGDEITVDFSRSSDQVPVALNSYINYTRAYTLFAVKVLHRRAAAAERRRHPADPRQGARGLVLQSARAGAERRPRHHPDPHLRGHQRRAGQGAARQGLRRLLALVATPTSAASTSAPASRSSCTT